MSLPPGAYYQLETPCTAELERKKSLFFTQLAPVQDRTAAEAVRAAMAARYSDCRHLCFAYVLGPPDKPLFTAAFDAGEPGGTAGRPMLNALLNRHIGDTVAVVARYFGGIKLGAGGLARAYGAAVSEALDQAQLVVCEPQATVTLTANYPTWDKLQRALAEHQARVISAAYGSEVAAELSLPARCLVDLQRVLTAIDHRLLLAVKNQ